MERPEIVLAEQIEVGVGQFTFQLRLMSDGSLGVDYSDESLTVSGELGPESMRKFALAAAQLKIKQLTEQLGPRAEDVRNGALRIPLADFDRVVSAHIGSVGGAGVATDETVGELGARVHSANVVAKLEAMGLDQWDAWDSLRYAAECVWQRWQSRASSSVLDSFFMTLRNALERVREEEDQTTAKREELVEDPDALVSPMFQGVHVDRLATCPAEKAAAQLWEAENLQASSLKRSPSMVSTWEPANSLLGKLLSRDLDRGIRPSPRDWIVASTVMQWLGTVRGRLFFTQLQMAANQKRGE